MPIEFTCGSCAKKLRVKDTAAGKKVRCSGCQTVQQVPAASPAPASRTGTSGPTTPSSNNWHVKAEDGQSYGPVSKEELDSWATEGRLTADSQILREGGDQWQWASDEYPQLAGARQPAPPDSGVDSENPFAFVAADTSPVARTRRSRSGSGGSPTPGSDKSPYAAPQTTSTTATGTAAGKQAATDPGWHSVDNGLLVSTVSLAVALGSLFVVSIGLFYWHSATHTQRLDGGAEGAYLMTVAMVWGVAGLVASSISLLTGWCLCLKVPRSAQADMQIRGAVGAIGLLLQMALVISLVPMAMITDDMQTMQKLSSLTNVMPWLMQVVANGAFVLFAFFLGALGKFFKDRQLPQFALFYAIFAAVDTLWDTLQAFVIKVNSKGMVTLVLVLLVVLSLTHFGWLLYMTYLTRQKVKVALRRG